MSTLLVLRTLLENQLNVGVTSAATDPTATLLNTYINNAYRLIARRDKPRELLGATPSSIDIVLGANTVAFPTTLIYPESVYYKTSGGEWKEVLPKIMKEMIFIEGESNFLKTTNTGTPSMYCIRGTSVVFNKYFSRSETASIKIFGLSYPASLSADGSTTEVSADYDMLVIYEASRLWYQRDDDTENQSKYQQLADVERTELKTSLSMNDQMTVDLDPYVYGGRYSSPMANPNTLFTS